MIHQDLNTMIGSVVDIFHDHATIVHTDRWQGVEIKSKPEMATHELLNVTMAAHINDEDPTTIARQVQPNMPWAEDHFRERISGQPLNPGETWKKWPWALHADRFRVVTTIDGGQNQFNHTYMERYWSRFAGKTPNGEVSLPLIGDPEPNVGIRYEYGDLDDLVRLLELDPFTRQAWIPIFFPEDTGYGDGGRKPCSLGYQFIRRDDQLHVYYPLRSCDIYRHMRDDIYLTVRLLVWVLQELRKRDSEWAQVKVGTLTMHATSLHCFLNDWYQLYGDA